MGRPFAALVIGIAIVSLAVQGRWLALNVQVPVILVAALERVTQPYSLGRIFAVTWFPTASEPDQTFLKENFTFTVTLAINDDRAPVSSPGSTSLPSSWDHPFVLSTENVWVMPSGWSLSLNQASETQDSGSISEGDSDSMSHEHSVLCFWHILVAYVRASSRGPRTGGRLGSWPKGTSHDCASLPSQVIRRTGLPGVRSARSGERQGRCHAFRIMNPVDVGWTYQSASTPPEPHDSNCTGASEVDITLVFRHFPSATFWIRKVPLSQFGVSRHALFGPLPRGVSMAWFTVSRPVSTPSATPPSRNSRVQYMLSAVGQGLPANSAARAVPLVKEVTDIPAARRAVARDMSSSLNRPDRTLGEGGFIFSSLDSTALRPGPRSRTGARRRPFAATRPTARHGRLPQIREGLMRHQGHAGTLCEAGWLPSSAPTSLQESGS